MNEILKKNYGKLLYHYIDISKVSTLEVSQFSNKDN